jgi:3',5'-cyclic-AMP phosphodiesterase
MILAQISDLHIKADGNYRPERGDLDARLQAVVADILSLPAPPDAVLLTGDLVEDGLPAEYARLRELLAPLTSPMFLACGNHDERGAMRAAFPDHAHLGTGGGPVHYVIEDFPVRLIVLDSWVKGESAGRLGAEQIQWLDDCLSAGPRRPAVVAVHHPPFLTGRRHVDRTGLHDGDEMAAVIRRHSQVERVVSGHVHQAVQVRWAGTLASTVQATAHQLTMDLRPEGKVRLRQEPPGYQLHYLTPEAGIVTVGRIAGHWPQPVS